MGRWFDVYAFRVGPADARRVAVLFTDITARKRTEDALRASEAALAEAQRVAGVGSWEWDPATDRNVVSGELCRIYGLPPGRPIPDFAAQDGTLYPHDSWVRLNAAVREALRTGVGYSLDVEALRGGERIWVTTRGEVVRDPSGRVAGLRGTVQDITARKAAEGEIARLAAESDRQRRVYETILSNTPDLAYVFGLDHRFTYANDVLLRMWGRTWDEAIGKNCLELGYEPWHAALHDREIEQVVATRRPIRGEVPFAGTFGRRIYDYIFVPVLGADGAVVAVAGTTRDVTDRKAAEEAVRASEERFRLAAEAVNGIIYEFDLRAGTVERTRGLAEVLGFGPDEAPPTAEWWRDRIHPDDRPRVVGGVDPAAAPDRLVTEYRVRHRDGRWLHVEDRAVVLRDPAGAPVRLVGCTVDVTARKAAEEAARDGRDRLDFVLRSAGIGLWLNPMPFGKMNWDERVKAHFHLPPDSDPDIDDFWARVHPDDRDRTRRAIDDALAGRADFDADYRTVDPAAGAERWVRAIGRPTFGPDGAPVRFDGVTLDVTARKRAEEALREEDRRKDEFLALLAHELRNPLAPLRNGLQVLRLAPPGSDAAAAAREMMDRQLGHMVRLVDDLLDVSRVTRDKMTLRKARVTLAEVITAAVEGAAPALEAAGHAFTVSLPPEPVELDADLTRLAQVFANLLTNSAKYTPKGGRVELIAECGVRNAESENPTEQSAFVEVTVRDTGLGIPAEFLPRLFDMFSQVDRSVEKATGGLGIGLALVKGLVEMHGGTVAAASPGPGKGSTFTVRLPTIAECGVRSADSKTEEPAHGPGLQSALRTPHSAIGRRRVLVVDDNRDSAESMAEMLRLLGNEVETAHDGLEAVAAAGRVRPDLVLMDVGMPKLNGLDATRRIRGEPWGAGMAIVALTGWGQDDDRARSRAAGCDGHLVKPVSLADLEAAVARVGAAGRNGTA
ncbi:MAG: PAS domain-containing protein [Gemmataceae bacterium]|nr:PAS domain-containing protein [Gemmataceae bacterium]